MDGAVQPGDDIGHPILIAEREVAQMPDGVVDPDPRIPARDQGFVHLLNVLERAVAELNDSGVIPMRIRCEEGRNHCQVPAKVRDRFSRNRDRTRSGEVDCEFPSGLAPPTAFDHNTQPVVPQVSFTS
jgi:hypothetical protein